MKVTAARFVGSYLALERSPTDRPAIALAGRSNVGKSTLLNRLLGRKALARTSRTPGRTRTLVYFAVDAEGIPPFYLVDLPGYGYAKASQAERERFAAAARSLLGQRDRLAGLLQLVDARIPVQASDLEMIEWLLEGAMPYALVFTKVDRAVGSAVATRLAEIRRALPWPREAQVFTAEPSGSDGVERLRAWVAATVRNVPSL